MHLLITGAWREAKEHIPELEAMGHEVRFIQWEQEELPCDADWVEGVICNGLFLHHPIEQFVNLRYIQLTSAGYDRVPMEHVKAHGIEIHNARGVYSIPMAEFAVLGVLQLYKQSRFFYDNQKLHRWEKRRGVWELAGKSVLILGCGSVGTECAKRFKAFSCKVIGVNRTVRENPAFDEIRPLTELNIILPEADVLVLTLGLSAETRHLIKAGRLALLKHGAVLVNIARGALIDTEALISALPNLTGAVLDVFEEEPLPESSPFWDAENVILTPHNSFVGEGNGERLRKTILSNLKR